MIWMEGRDPAGAHDCEINIKFHIPRAAPTILPTMGGAVCLFTVKDIAPRLSQYSPSPGRNIIIIFCHVTTIQEMEFHHSSYPLFLWQRFQFHTSGGVLHFCILIVINIVFNVINMVVLIILIMIEEEEKLCGAGGF